MPLQKRIGILVLSGLAIGLGLFSWLGLRSLNESTGRVLEERLSIARIMTRHLDETLSHLLVHLGNVASTVSENPTEAEFNNSADSLRRMFADSDISIRTVILADTQGRVIQVEPDSPKIRGAVMTEYEEVRRALESGVAGISNLINTLADEPVILAAVPVLNEKGEIEAVLAATIELQSSGIGSLSQTMQIGNTGYIEVVDGNGSVLARTEPGLPLKLDEKSDHPARFADLIREGKTTTGTCHRCHETSEELQRRRDVLAFAPLSAAPWGIAIRQSEEEALAPTQQLERRLFFLGATVLMVTLFLVWIMMRGIVKPIRMLTAAAKRVAAGDLKTVVEVRQGDEIGELGAAFQTMTRELAKSRNELVSRNEELSALNSIAGTVSQSLDIWDVLGSALEKVLEITRTKTGCVFLRTLDSQELDMIKYIGSPDAFRCRESGSPLAECACHRVLGCGQVTLVNDISQCPVLDNVALRNDKVAYFISVPLKSKNRTLGVMNIAGPAERYFTENDFILLDSIGSHVGLAIDNSILYKEARQKEELRGQLLSRVISAQEEERKRIARELHDEFGQTLAGLIMSIEHLEDITSPAQSQIRERLKDARSLVGRALEDIRRLTLDLRPSALDYLGLVDTIRLYTRTHLEELGIHVSFESKSLNQRLVPVVELALFRIIQEAINNITKYAGAQNVKITLEARGGKIMATVEDDGKGFDTDDVLKNRAGRQSLGLIGMKERVALLGGVLNIESRIGQGTCLTVEVPSGTLPV